MVKLTSHHLNPFEGWVDWSGENEDGENVVVTFHTIQHQLYSVWERHCYDADTPHIEMGMEDFEEDDVVPPGVYQDRDRPTFDPPEDADLSDWDNCYTIVVPFAFMNEKICNKFLKKLNEKYDTDFELYGTCVQCGDDLPLGENYHPEDKIPEKERWKNDRVLCTEECYENYEGQEHAPMAQTSSDGDDAADVELA